MFVTLYVGRPTSVFSGIPGKNRRHVQVVVELVADELVVDRHIDIARVRVVQRNDARCFGTSARYLPVRSLPAASTVDSCTFAMSNTYAADTPQWPFTRYDTSVWNPPMFVLPRFWRWRQSVRPRNPV